MSIQEQHLKEIADAIRFKKETTEPIKASKFAEEIMNLKGGINIQPVSNLQLSEFGVLTFDDPDMSELVDYNPVLSYIITVNDTTVTSIVNSINVFNYLVDGDNNISVVAKVVLQSNSDSKEEIIAYSPPVYTNIADFTLESVTVGSETGYKITAYNGSANEINIPLTNSDGLPILACGNLAVPKISGVGIKQIGSFENNKTITEVDFPSTINTTMKSCFSGCSKLERVNINTSEVTSFNTAFCNCTELKELVLDTKNATDMYMAVGWCSALETLILSDCSKVTGNLALSGARNLKTLRCPNVNVDVWITDCSKLEREALIVIMEDLAAVTTPKTLYMGSTNLAKLTDEDQAIAIAKNWTLK